MHAQSRQATLALLGWATLLLGGCSSLPSRIPPTMDRPKDPSVQASTLDTLTQHNGAARGGAYLSETRLDPSSVGSGRFERLFDWKVDGQIYTQPLYVSQVPVHGSTCPDARQDSRRLINLVVVATTNNSVYAFEAPSADSDVQPCKDPLWRVGSDQLGKPLPYDFFVIDWGVLGHNMRPLIGITATPVIDRQRGLVYVTVKTGYSASWDVFDLFGWTTYRLFAIDLVSGQIVAGVNITASYAPAAGAQAAQLDAKYHLQRPALLEANDRIYLAFGSHQDTGPYHGWLLAYDAGTLKPLHAYCTTCANVVSDDCSHGSCQGGIWQAGAGPASDDEGNVYVMTGNGTYDRKAGNRGTSFIKLNKDLTVTGSWTPAEYGCLNNIDADLGSAGPTYLAGAKVVVGGGKEGVLYALSTNALNGAQVQLGQVGTQDPCGLPVMPKGPGYWSIQAAPTWNEDGFMDMVRIIDDTVSTQGFHHLHGSPVQWTVRDHDRERTLLYISAERDQLRAYEFDKDQGFVSASPPGEGPTDTFHSRCRNSDKGMPGGFLTVSADGDKPESGIVWAVMPRRNQDALNNTVRGVLRAYRAYQDDGNELKEIWNSDIGTGVARSQDCEDRAPLDARRADSLGDFAKFAPPTVAEGKVYVSTFSHRLVAYGLEQPAAGAPPEGQPMPYDARLEIATKMPLSVEPQSSFDVSIVATNTGTKSWSVQDDIHLGSRAVPGDPATDADADAPKVLREVPPLGTYRFDLRLKAGDLEESRDFSWRMIRLAGEPKPKQPSGEWFGAPTAEATLVTLRSSCLDLRARATNLHTQAMAVWPRLHHEPTDDDRNEAKSLKAQIQALKQEAASRKCSLRAGVDAAMEHVPAGH
jgi:hypothetical protein